MKSFSQKARRAHSVDALSALLLFVFFVLFLLLLMLFSAEAYRAAVRGQQQNNNLYTAQTYLTTKFRRYDTADGTSTNTQSDTASTDSLNESADAISIDALNGTAALKFTETIDGETYDTWLYLYDGKLKELFTAASSQADPTLGTDIAELSVFEPSFNESGFLEILLEDTEGNTASLLLHPGVPDA